VSAVRGELLACLADGACHSGPALAGRLGVSRAAIGKQVARLRGEGWGIRVQPGRGYRLPGQQCPLQRAALETALAPQRAALDSLALYQQLDSTSAQLDRQQVPADGRAALCIAEAQSSGRGRQGRAWHSAPGCSVTFSAARVFARAPAELGALGLAIGVGLAELLHAYGADHVRLKWPNDLVCGGAKLGGLLIEVRGEAAGRARATVGVGLNYAPLDGATRAEATSGERVALTELLAEPPTRQALAGAAMATVVRDMARFNAAGLAPFRARWAALDMLRDRPVRVFDAAQVVHGRARGIATDGALRLESPTGEWRNVYSGEVSIRPQS